jgi:hypothetical protein
LIDGDTLPGRMPERYRARDNLRQNVEDADGHDGRTPLDEESLRKREGNVGLRVKRVWIILIELESVHLSALQRSPGVLSGQASGGAKQD